MNEYVLCYSISTNLIDQLMVEVWNFQVSDTAHRLSQVPRCKILLQQQLDLTNQGFDRPGCDRDNQICIYETKKVTETLSVRKYVKKYLIESSHFILYIAY